MPFEQLFLSNDCSIGPIYIVLSGLGVYTDLGILTAQVNESTGQVNQRVMNGTFAF